ncbi:MAG: hypothetical protein SGARI_000465, partial [Bacillariaceae sp.]
DEPKPHNPRRKGQQKGNKAEESSGEEEDAVVVGVEEKDLLREVGPAVEEKTMRMELGAEMEHGNRHPSFNDRKIQHFKDLEPRFLSRILVGCT